MSGTGTPQLRDLAAICRKLANTRERVLELEEQRDRLIAELRAAGVTGAVLAECTGLSAGRIAQIKHNGG